MDNKETEDIILDLIAEKIGRNMFDVWFTNDIHFALEDSTLVMSAPSNFICNWIRTNFKHIIEQVSRDLFKKTIPLRFTIKETSSGSSLSSEIAQSENHSGKKKISESSKSKSSVSRSPSAKSEKPTKSAKQTDEEAAPVQFEKDGKYEYLVGKSVPGSAKRTSSGSQRDLASYDSFVVGKSNELAKSIADIVIKEPAKFNPVLISGPTSVGKTHLLEGICSEYRARYKKKQALFLTADQFTSMFVQGVQGGLQNFRARFRNISLLIIDDLHFLQTRRGTQTELLGLIDMLKGYRVQMVFSTSCPLSDLKDFRSELTSRLMSGIDCRIEAAERETLLKIFRQMVSKRGISIPDEVCRYVVSRFSTHARRLSGVLNRLYVEHVKTSAPIDLRMAQDVLSDLESSCRRTYTLEEVEQAVLEVFGISNTTLRSKSRAQANCYPRMLAMWAARKYTNAALSEIGRYFGNRSHSTVLSAQKRVDLWLDVNAPHQKEDRTWNIAETLSRIERIIER